MQFSVLFLIKQKNIIHFLKHIPNSVSGLKHVFWPERDSCLDAGLARPKPQDISVSPVVKGMTRTQI